MYFILCFGFEPHTAVLRLIPGKACGTIWGVGDQTPVSHQQSMCPTYTVSGLNTCILNLGERIVVISFRKDIFITLILESANTYRSIDCATQIPITFYS